MTDLLLDGAGRRRSPATMPGFHAGRPPRNRGMRYPADPPTIEEIVAVMRAAGDNAHGRRLRALIVVLWRAGLRIHEAPRARRVGPRPAPRRAAGAPRKGEKRREVGMDEWGWEHLRRWVSHRTQLPVGPLFCVVKGATRGRPLAQTAVRAQCAARRRGGGATAVRSASTAPRPCDRDGARRRCAQHHPALARPHRPRRHLDLPTRH